MGALPGWWQALAVCVLSLEPPLADRFPAQAAPQTVIDAAGERLLAPVRELSLRPDLQIDALGLRGDELVADVGAGPGFFSLRLAQRLTRGRLIATDVSAPYLARLRERARAAGLSNVETRLVAPGEVGLSPASVDLIFLCQVDHYLPDRAVAFRAFFAALRPGGRLVVINSGRFAEVNRQAFAAAGLPAVETESAAPGYPKFVAKKQR